MEKAPNHQSAMALESLIMKPMATAYHLLNTSFYLSMFCCLICILFVHKVHSRARRSKNIYNLPPSPPKLPIIGNLHQLGSLPHQSFRALSHKYGPLMSLQLGQTPAVVVSSAHVAQEIVKSHDVLFSNRPQNTAHRILLYGCKDIAFSVHGEEWRQKRKISVIELFSQKRVRSYRFIREEEVSCLINKIREGCESGCSINLTKMLVTTSNNIVSRCALGHKYETLHGKGSFDEIGRRLMQQLEEFSFGNFFPSLGWMDYLTRLIPRVKQTFRELDAFFENVIEQHKAELKSKKNDDVKNFLDILVEVQQDNMLGFELTRDSIKAMLVDMFVGGSDTSATTLEWGMAELMRQPDKMKKVQEEVRRVVGLKSKIEEDDLNEMKYLKCVIKETMRLHPAAPLLVPRETTSDVKLRGYDIPSKTVVFVNAWAIQRDPEFWERAEEFIPERFEKIEIDYKGQDYELIPFGIGRRGCPGIAFGVASLESVFANLLCWFDWKLPVGTAKPEDLDMTELNGLTVSKKEPLYLQPSLHAIA